MKATIEFDKDFVEMVASSGLSCPYWIDELRIVGDVKGKYTSEHIANGGTIKIRDYESGEWYTVTSKKFANAIGKYVQMLYVDKSVSGYLDDATAEQVFQIACFGDVIYG